MLYYIMNRDIVAVIIEKTNNPALPFETIRQVGVVPFRLDLYNLNNWIKKRKLPAGRENIKEILYEPRLRSDIDYVDVTKAVSFNDTLWIKSEYDTCVWRDVSPYTNPLNRAMSALTLANGGTITGLNTAYSPEFSTGGVFPKCWRRSNGVTYLVKGGWLNPNGLVNASGVPSNKNSGSVFGLEPFSDYFVAQLAVALGLVRVTKYNLAKSRGRLVSTCKLFNSEQVGFLPMHSISEKASLQDDLNFYASLNCEDQFRRMLVLDSIVINTDRHRGNYGVLINNRNFKPLSIAPVFDNNLALLPRIPLNSVSNSVIKQYKKEHDVSKNTATSFVRQAKIVMTPEILYDVLRLTNFSFRQHDSIKMDSIRFKFINTLIKEQVSSIIEACTHIHPISYVAVDKDKK